jgi:hypothetical protein
MRKSPADEYFERMKIAAAEVIKPKKWFNEQKLIKKKFVFLK